MLARLLEKLEHPDHDIEERALLALVSLSRRTQARHMVTQEGGLQTVQRAQQRCKDLLGEADEDYREILQDLIVLASDLEELLKQPALDRSEL